MIDKCIPKSSVDDIASLSKINMKLPINFKFLLQRASFSTKPPKKPIAFSFDIDGVLLRGKQVFPEAQRALQLLQREDIPFIILTNGGGVLEVDKAAQLTKQLNLLKPITKDQVVLSHSPMKSLVGKYRDKLALVVGPQKCKEVALSYGFKNIITSEELYNRHPHIWPFGSKSHESHHNNSLDDLEDFSTILVMHDSMAWGRDLQVMLDVLTSHNGRILQDRHHTQTEQATTLYFSNSDTLWKSNFDRLRFAQGAFQLAFRSLYAELVTSKGGGELKYKSFGKPTKETYDYAKDLLEKLILAKYLKNNQGSSLPPPLPIDPSSVFMIGDNPASDIKGANNAGWNSMLVSTGVWNQERDGEKHGAKFVCKDVEEAVLVALRLNG